jgi:hypothetical protein
VHGQQYPGRGGTVLQDIEYRFSAFVEQTDGIDVGQHRPLGHVATIDRGSRYLPRKA